MNKNIEELLMIGISILLIIIALNSFLSYNHKINDYYNNAIKNSNSNNKHYTDNTLMYTKVVRGEIITYKILNIHNNSYELIIDGINYNTLLKDSITNYEIIEKANLSLLINNKYKENYIASPQGKIIKIIYEKL